MDLEQLTKHQIVLLTLLVSFVTSIATGIVTVALMNQAPPGVTRTINQIVEHTIEKVVPTTQGAATVTEKTVVVKDDDLAAKSIAAVQKSIIRITAKGDDKLVARGVIVDAKGTALTDSGALASSGAEFDAILYSGERVAVVLPKEHGTSSPLLTLQVLVGTSTGFAPATLGDLAKLQLGQSIIRIGGKGTDSVGSGVVASLPSQGTPAIETNVTSVTAGSLIMTLFGEVVGISTSESQVQGSDFYTPIIVTKPVTSNQTN